MRNTIRKRYGVDADFFLIRRKKSPFPKLPGYLYLFRRPKETEKKANPRETLAEIWRKTTANAWQRGTPGNNEPLLCGVLTNLFPLQPTPVWRCASLLSVSLVSVMRTFLLDAPRPPAWESRPLTFFRSAQARHPPVRPHSAWRGWTCCWVVTASLHWSSETRGTKLSSAFSVVNWTLSRALGRRGGKK